MEYCQLCSNNCLLKVKNLMLDIYLHEIFINRIAVYLFVFNHNYMNYLLVVPNGVV